MKTNFQEFVNEQFKNSHYNKLKEYRIFFRNSNEMVEIAQILKNIGFDVYNYNEIVRLKNMGNKTNFKWNGERFNRSNLPYNEMGEAIGLNGLKDFLKSPTKKTKSKNLKSYTITFDNIQEMKEEINIIISSGYKVIDYNTLLNKKSVEGYDCFIWSIIRGGFIRGKKFLMSNKINLKELKEISGENLMKRYVDSTIDPFAEEEWIPTKEASQYGDFSIPATSEEDLTNYYFCSDCGKSFYLFNEEQPSCKCGSTNINQISDFDYFTNLKKSSDKSLFNKEIGLKKKRETDLVELNDLDVFKRVKNYRKTIS